MSVSSFARAGLFAALLLVCGPTLAQSNDPHKALAHELLEVIRVNQQIDRMTQQVADQTSQFMQQSRPGMKEDEAKAFGKSYAEAIKMNIGDLVDEIAKLYVRQYSDDELKQIVAFYKSPVGQKYLDNAPSLSAQAASLAQAWQQKNEQAAQAVAAQEMKKLGYKNW